MNWLVFAIMGYLLIGLQRGLAGLLAIPVGSYGYLQPSLLAVLGALIALNAQDRAILPACGILGLVADLFAGYPVADAMGRTEMMTLIGPHTLGFMLCGWLILRIRGVMLNTHPISLAVCSVIAVWSIQMAVLAILTLRNGMDLLLSRVLGLSGWYAPLLGWGLTDQLVNGLLAGLYTGVVALLIAWPLLRLLPLLGIAPLKRARGG